MTRSALYWPSIEYRTDDDTFHPLSTTEPVRSMKVAKDVITCWAEDFHIMHAWVDVYTTDEYGDEHRRRSSFF